MSSAAPQKTQFLMLQVWRALAAFIVMAGHVNNEALSVSKNTGLEYGYIRYPSAVGVDIFFVISGFVIVYASRNLAGNGQSWKNFIARRFIRIAPLYWFYTTLMIGVALIMPHALDTAKLEPWHLVKSYLFIPHIRPIGDAVRPFMNLGWSLNYEMYFYAIFACLLFLPLNRLIASLSLLLIASVIIGFYLPADWIALRFWFNPFVLEFLSGALIAYAYIGGYRLPASVFWPMTMSAFLILLYIFIPPGDSPQGEFSRFIVGIILVAAATLPRGLENANPPKYLVALGDSSYSLYLSHPFVIGALKILFLSLGLSLGFYFFAALIACTLAGYIAYRIIEKPMQQFLLAQLQVKHASQ